MCDVGKLGGEVCDVCDVGWWVVRCVMWGGGW